MEAIFVYGTAGFEACPGRYQFFLYLDALLH